MEIPTVQQETLPGAVPTARVVLELLLGPGAEIVVINLWVRDPTGALIALRAFPGSKHLAASEHLDRAWVALLDALPHEVWTAHYD